MLQSLLRRIYYRWLAANDRAGAGTALQAYPFLNVVMLDALEEEPRLQPRYLWGLVHAMYQAQQLAVPRIELLEFGTGGGDGAMLLQRGAEIVGRRLGVAGLVTTFDIGSGNPELIDLRDMPHHHKVGDFSDFDPAAVAAKIAPARLVVGPYDETVANWMRTDRETPVGFVAFDTGMFTPTRTAMEAVFENSPADALMPRTHCYFNCVQQYSYGWCNGELRAIAVHNDVERRDDMHTEWRRPLARIEGLTYDGVPRRFRHQRWVQEQYLLHVFDHQRYREPDMLLRWPQSVARRDDAPLPETLELV